MITTDIARSSFVFKAHFFIPIQSVFPLNAQFLGNWNDASSAMSICEVNLPVCFLLALINTRSFRIAKTK